MTLTKSKKSAKLKGYFDVTLCFAKFDSISNSEDINIVLYRVVLRKNGYFTTLYFKDKGLFLRFQIHLRRICLLSSFNNDYDSVRYIGSGSRSRVKER